MGRPRLLLSKPAVLGHRPPPGRQIQERGHPALHAQPRSEEGNLELHPLCVGNPVRLLLHCSLPLGVKTLDHFIFI